MAILPTIQIGHPSLQVENILIKDFSDPKVKQVTDDLVETMRSVGLIGMAAPQIGENYQLFVTEPRATTFRSATQSDELRVYINPKIIKFSQKQSTIFEGCGSVLTGQVFGPVIRSSQITVEAKNADGKVFRLTCDGILARVIQHEIDHLNGIEFLERVSDYKQIMALGHYQKNIKNSVDQIESSKITLLKCDFA